MAVLETEDGVFISRQEVLGTRELKRIGEVLRERVLTLEELIESGREARADILKERYGIGPEEHAS